MTPSMATPASKYSTAEPGNLSRTVLLALAICGTMTILSERQQGMIGGTDADDFDGGPDNDTVTDFTAGQGDTRVNIP